VYLDWLGEIMTRKSYMGLQIERELEIFEEGASSRTELRAESWKQPHQIAMFCRDLEDEIAFGLHIAKRLTMRHHEWRDMTAAGKCAYDPLAEESFKKKFSDWMAIAKKVQTFAKKFEEKSGHTVDGLVELGKAIEESPLNRQPMTKRRFAALVKKHPIDPHRYDQGEKSLAHLDEGE
jgi:hypothetical protein